MEHIIITLKSVDDARFGMSQDQLRHLKGIPDCTSINRRGEAELHYGPTTYRFSADQLVECTFPNNGSISVDGQRLTSVRSWLQTKQSVDRLGFRIAPSQGIAVDLQDENIEYVTAFQKGRWDRILSING